MCNSWIIKPGNRNMIALRKGRTEIGGALDDRAHFTAVRCAAAVMHPGPDFASLRFEATHTSGLAIIKHLDLQKGSRALSPKLTRTSTGSTAKKNAWARSRPAPQGGHSAVARDLRDRG
ncbi:MAG: hypothetical protein KAI66_21105 [Lentisphaeria bacterium]|nr:hypothetical protein [Lentisphaeria bacterium]